MYDLSMAAVLFPMPYPLKVIALNIKAGVVPAKDDAKNSLVFALRNWHLIKFAHALGEVVIGLGKGFANRKGIVRTTGNIVRFVVWIDD